MTGWLAVPLIVFVVPLAAQTGESLIKSSDCSSSTGCTWARGSVMMRADDKSSLRFSPGEETSQSANPTG